MGGKQKRRNNNNRNNNNDNNNKQRSIGNKIIHGPVSHPYLGKCVNIIHS